MFHDGIAHPELVLIHYAAAPENSPGDVLARSTVVVPPTRIRGTREVRLFLPRLPDGGRVRLTYFFSTVVAGSEWFSPPYDLVLPGPEAGGDVDVIEEEGEGNAGPAAGRGMFRMALPLRPEEPREGTVRYGFGAMRKKPSVSLCRARVPIVGGDAPVVEVPEALSVLKNRPMPFFLYHVPEEGTVPIADKINCARITLRDEEGDIVCARALWGERSWAAHNLTVMEAKNFASEEGRASGYFHAADRNAYLRVRSAILAGHPLPRTFEGFVFGPSDSVVEYCFQVLRIRAGQAVASWVNAPSGRNWTVTL
ncbi:MAG TPA: hypothetical protein VFU42_06030 [Candidatus Deferrimicrobiaceae bacterium]|nr:hypothetical protein [Candidatus Deferrimicrobiaceae bacterium]